jgi:uncharacterized membrane protein
MRDARRIGATTLAVAGGMVASMAAVAHAIAAKLSPTLTVPVFGAFAGDG